MKQGKTCGGCIHFHKDAPTGENLKPTTGECRYNPPSATVLPGPQGMVRLCAYPSVDNQMPQCSKYVAKVVEENDGPTLQFPGKKL